MKEAQEVAVKTGADPKLIFGDAYAKFVVAAKARREKAGEVETKIEQSPAPPEDLPSAADPLPASSEYCVGDFHTVLELLQVLRPNLTAHQWQVETLEHLSGYFGGVAGPLAKPTASKPLYYNVVAANGAGKDSYIIAPFAVWFAITKIRSRVIITSKTHDQLKHQTFNYIASFCKEFNTLVGEKVFDITEFNINCLKTGSQIRCFVTNEAGNAEGYHPFPDVPDAEMAIIINEAKSIDDSLWTGFARFTGYNYWIEISSPGPRSGHFFRTSTSTRAIFPPDIPQLGKRFVRKVTAFDCPNIAAAHITEQIADNGESSAFVQSSIFANFTDIDESNLIKTEAYDRCVAAKPAKSGNDIGIGLDLAAGGDENSSIIRMGNRVLTSKFFRQKNTEVTADALHEFLLPYFDADYTFRADAGGVGVAIIYNLEARGWRIQHTHNQSPAFDRARYLNLGAELWDHMKKLIDRCQIILPPIEKLREQITGRNIRGLYSTQGKLALESKPEARASGRPSPDRADAFVLCFSSYRHEQAALVIDERRLVTAQELLVMYRNGLPNMEPVVKPKYQIHTIQLGQ